MSKKLYSKFLLPYRFRGYGLQDLNFSKKLNLISPLQMVYYLKLESLKNFPMSFSNILSAIEENDREYLNLVMEPRLYKATLDSLDKLKEENMKIKLIGEINQDELDENADLRNTTVKNSFFQYKGQNYDLLRAQKMKPHSNEWINKIPFIFESENIKFYATAIGVYGIDIDRSLNDNSDKKLLSIFRNSNKYFYYNYKNWKEIYQKQVLVLNIYFHSKVKLCIYDSENNLIEGDEDQDSWSIHKWRFETYTPNLDWVLTDVDDFLNGNPYFKNRN